MPLKRKIHPFSRNNDQMSIFEPVYQHDGLSFSDDAEESEGLADGIPRANQPPQAHEDPVGNMISKSKLIQRIEQIDNSIEQARTMLDAMNKIKNLVPDNDQQCEKLRSILSNLEDQKTGYENLLQLIEFSTQEQQNPSPPRPRVETKTSFTTRNNEGNMDQVIQLQKEQLRALQEQKRALLALKERSKQQDLPESNADPSPTMNEKTSLLFDIHHLRDRLISLRNLYEEKHQLQRMKKSSIKAKLPTEKGLKELEGVQHRLDELEEMVLSHQDNEGAQGDEEDNEDVETIIERPSRSVHYRKPSEPMDQLAMRRAELQKMIEKIRLTDASSAAPPSPTKSSVLEKAMNPPLFTPTSSQYTQTELTCSKMKTSFLSDTPLSPDDQEFYDERLNDSKNRRPRYQAIDEALQQDDSIYPRQPRLQQSNVHGAEVIFSNYDHLSAQMDRITRCLSTFIEEQRAFNQQIEERLSKSQQSQPNDQFQQQVVTQGLLVNLNTAYREIAVLQAEINALQSENTRLTSSISFDQQYHHASPTHFHQTTEKVDHAMPRSVRPQPRTLLKEYRTDHETRDTDDLSPDRVDKCNIEHIKWEKETPIVDERQESFTPENVASPRPNPLCTRYVCRSENQQTNGFHRAASLQNKSHDAEQFDDLSYMLSAISHPYQNIANSTDLDLKTLDLQIKSILIPLVPFLRAHIHDTFDSNLVDELQQRTFVLFHQQLSATGSLSRLPDHLFHSIERTFKKYIGTGVREKASSLIHDLSEIAFNELIVQQNQYSNLYDAAARCHLSESTSQIDDQVQNPTEFPADENEEDDEELDDEEAVAAEISIPRPRKISPTLTELHSNGQDYVLVNEATHFQNTIENEIVNDILT